MMRHTPQSLAKQFSHGVYVNSSDALLWREAFTYLSSINDDSIFVKDKVRSLWLTYGSDLRARIKDDNLILQVLQKSLPRYSGDGWTLYRGESWFLFDTNQIGFFWTPSETLATTYAQGINAVESGGVLLKCYAPTEAILAAPEAEGENSVWICDPTQLLRLSTLALFPKL